LPIVLHEYFMRFTGLGDDLVPTHTIKACSDMLYVISVILEDFSGFPTSV
jgi:hypothetical protein